MAPWVVAPKLAALAPSLFSLEVGQYLVNYLLLFDAGNDFDWSTAMRARLHVNVEYTLEPLSPVH